eukprot:TRINITY_DN32290_c0_g1_i1.p1 TRINITY_DN32290_c0_g1~~TRINITY_DN32290_c0_g1_i1.p1  ORF type:complete len:235 (+),score=39.59 TRINITY_DN32290_c0_g1_i1:95-706(+)
MAVDVDADDAHIRHAYRRLALRLHPDKPTGDAEQFLELTRAYATLTDKELRSRHDEELRLREAGIDVEERPRHVIFRPKPSREVAEELQQDLRDLLAALKRGLEGEQLLASAESLRLHMQRLLLREDRPQDQRIGRDECKRREDGIGFAIGRRDRYADAGASAESVVDKNGRAAAGGRCQERTCLVGHHNARGSGVRDVSDFL